MISAAETAMVVLATLFFCVSMTIPADTMRGFDKLFDLMMLLCIIYGAALSIIKHREADKSIVLLTVLYFIARLISYRLNDLPVTYGGTIMLQMFYLIGINKFLFGGRKRVLTALYTFIAFDIAAILICYFNLCFRRDYVNRLLEEYEGRGMTAQTSLFQNPNYAGMMAGAAIVICCALMLNSKFNKTTVLVTAPILLINAVMLFIHSGCRSAQTGLIVIAIITAFICVFRKVDSIKRALAATLLICFITLIPLYALVYYRNNDLNIADVSQLEWDLEAVSSERYAIWKTTILSMKGHELFGFGNVTTAWNKRKEVVNNSPPEWTSEVYYHSTVHKRQHNGYLALYNEAGLTGLVCMLLLMLRRIKQLKGRFRDGQWEKMLLIYIFWINLFEAKFVLHLFFTGFLMMVLLLPPEEEAPAQAD